MLELSDAQLEVFHGAARCDAELLGQPSCGIARLFSHPPGLTAPALERVSECGTNFATLEPEPAGEIVGDVVDATGGQRKRADTGKGQFLERAASAIAIGHEASTRDAAGGAPVLTTTPVEGWCPRWPLLVPESAPDRAAA